MVSFSTIKLCYRAKAVLLLSHVQKPSRVQLCQSMDCSMPGFPVLHYLSKLAQTHVHWVGDAIQWSHPLSSPFSSCFQSFPESGSLTMNCFFSLSDQSIGASVSVSILPMNIQDWFPLGWTGWISLQSKGLSKVFSNTTVQKHQFFGVKFSLWSNSPISTWLLVKHSSDYMNLCQQSNVFVF